MAYRWRVDCITNTRGITIEFAYQEEEEDVSANWRETASYLQSIRYNRDSGAGRLQTEIGFDREERPATGAGVLDGHWNSSTAYFYQTEYLSAIRVLNWNGSDMETVRSYHLTYTETVPTQEKHTRLLYTIMERGQGSASLPATTFGYVSLGNKITYCLPFSCTDWTQERFVYARLTSIASGQGGATSCTYGTPDDPDQPEQNDQFAGRKLTYNYRVERKDLSDGQAKGARTDYSYTPRKSDRGYYINNTPGCDYFYSNEGTGGQLVGYRFVTETLKTLSDSTTAIITHTFKLDTDGTPDPRLGRELATIVKDASGNDLSKTTTDWEKHKTLDPEFWLVPECYYVYPTTVKQYSREGGGLPASPQKKVEYGYWFHSKTNDNGGGTIYSYDSSYGYLTAAKEYIGSTLAREMEYEYATNASVDGYDLCPNGPWLTDRLAR